MSNLTRFQKKQERRQVDLSTLVYGKIPPQEIEAEKAVLGAIMLERDAFDAVNEIVKAESFYADAHQKIYAAIVSQRHRGQPCDYITLALELNRQQQLELVGGAYYLTELTKNVVSSAHIEAHAFAIQEAYMNRRLITISGETINAAYEGKDVFETLDEHEKQLTELTASNIQGKVTPIDKAVVSSLQRLEHLQQQQTDITGVPSGFEDLDKVTYGWQPTDLIILAARPAVGKTAYALNLLLNAAKAGIGALFFSMEMSTGQLMNRLYSIESGILLEKIMRGKLEPHEYEIIFSKTAPYLSGLPIKFDDTAALNLMQLASKCRKVKRKMPSLGLIIIDYLQLMSGGGNKNQIREQEISTISRGLKTLAKELQVPIIALSQLSRAVESRQGEKKMPQLSDLRESGAIEQDADMVMFIYRPEYYDINSDEMGNSNKGETHIRIAKHRNGSLETIKLRAKLHVQRFEKMDGAELAGMLPAGNGQRWKPVSDLPENRPVNGNDLPF